MKKTTLLFIIFIIIALGGGAAYWYLYMRPNIATPNTTTQDTTTPNPFAPLDRDTGTVQLPESQQAPVTPQKQQPQNQPKQVKLRSLRQLSENPTGGMSASSTGVRFIDRGTGHVYEALNDSPDIVQISNTTLPMVSESYWNKGLTAFILRYIKADSQIITNLSAELKKTASSTTTFEMKGKYMSDKIDQIAVSPTGDKIFTWTIENGRGMGYISSFDEKNKTKIVDSPITQALIEWPEANTVTFTTKASASASGYEYMVDTKSASSKKVFGAIHGLSTKTSKDLKKVLYSSGGADTIKTSLFNTKDRSSQEVIFRTLADKCVWSTLRKNEVYCAVPTEIPTGIYPDDWYKGSISFVDQIWHLDTTTGEVHLIANLLSLSNKLIDATQLTLDPQENFLYFINKRDLTLWSLDLNL